MKMVLHKVRITKIFSSTFCLTFKPFLLNRLVRKDALSYESIGRIYHYSAKVSEAECVSAATRSFLDRVFDGSLPGMMAHYVESRKLSKAQISELRRILESETSE